jgi:hypothetical protein
MLLSGREVNDVAGSDLDYPFAFLLRPVPVTMYRI